MPCIIRVAPLRSMPAEHSLFDYAWTLSEEPRIGSVIEISFRKKIVFALITGVLSSTLFKVKNIDAQKQVQILTEKEVDFLNKVAKKNSVATGTLAQLMIPPFTKRSLNQFERSGVANQGPVKKEFKYFWYTDPSSHKSAILKAFEQAKKNGGNIGILTFSHERAQELISLLADITVHHYTSKSVSNRKKIWSEWVSSASATYVCGTHLAAWLPHTSNTTWIVDEPTHPFHEEWGTSHFSNTDIIHIRRTLFGEHAYYITHSPATNDLHKISIIPTLHAWPIIIDRTTEDPASRTALLSPHTEEELKRATKILFFVTHLKKSTHTICRDCSMLYDTQKNDSILECTNCKSTNFFELGFGAKMLAQDLIKNGIIPSMETITLFDAKTFKKIEAETKIVIATAPLYDRIPLHEFDIIIDLATDFELLHPNWKSEELLWGRLRAMSARIPKNWSGIWYCQTRKPDLRAWAMRDSAGYQTWLKHELPLRKRFGQQPFNT